MKIICQIALNREIKALTGHWKHWTGAFICISLTLVAMAAKPLQMEF